MKKLFYVTTVILLFSILLYKTYDLLNYTHITAKFKELRPYSKQIPVYYKGIIVGKAKENSHTIDLQHTIINISIKRKNLKLPNNIEVHLKKYKNKDVFFDYLEIIYPQEPSNKYLQNGSSVKGVAFVDFEDYMSNHHPDDLEIIKQNLTESSENLKNMLAGLSEIFIILNDMLEENRTSLNETNKNLSSATKNLNIITEKINNSIEEKSLNNTLINLENTSRNFEEISKNLTKASTEINELIPKTDTLLCEIYSITNNANSISNGIKETLQKPFGGIRLIFGKVIEE